MSEVEQFKAMVKRQDAALERSDDLLVSVAAERDRYRAALEKLARLGNEPHYGNSDGNRIAQEALGVEVGVDA